MATDPYPEELVQDDALVVSGTVRIPLAEIEFQYSRSGGPGGQNVNKVSSRVQLRWNVTAAVLRDEVRTRLIAQNRNRITKEGELLLVCQEHRDQPRNREACLTKLQEMLRAALIAPKARRPSRPTKGSKERRLKEKKHSAQRRDARRTDGGD
jgi:ribosome-associated protein